jgi:hypothetical protein
MRTTRSCAGTQSSISLVASPIEWRRPPQPGQSWLSTSSLTSFRGKCPGSVKRRDAVLDLGFSSLADGGT